MIMKLIFLYCVASFVFTLIADTKAEIVESMKNSRPHIVPTSQLLTAEEESYSPAEEVSSSKGKNVPKVKMYITVFLGTPGKLIWIFHLYCIIFIFMPIFHIISLVKCYTISCRTYFGIAYFYYFFSFLQLFLTYSYILISMSLLIVKYLSECWR